jgi:Ca2+-binding RTX toxin-like protein
MAAKLTITPDTGLVGDNFSNINANIKLNFTEIKVSQFGSALFSGTANLFVGKVTDINNEHVIQTQIQIVNGVGSFVVPQTPAGDGAYSVIVTPLQGGPIPFPGEPSLFRFDTDTVAPKVANFKQIRKADGAIVAAPTTPIVGVDDIKVVVTFSEKVFDPNNGNFKLGVKDFTLAAPGLVNAKIIKVTDISNNTNTRFEVVVDTGDQAHQGSIKLTASKANIIDQPGNKLVGNLDSAVIKVLVPNLINGTPGNDANLKATNFTDFVDGKAGVDTLSYANSTAAVTANLTTGKGTGSFAQGDTYKNIENLIGSRFLDKLTGNAQANELKGEGGNDRLDGGAGNDTLRGAAGNDTEIGGAGNDRMAGGGGNDTLNGNAGNDSMFGEDGDDVLTGGLGKDTMNGGRGGDAFTFNTAAEIGKGAARDIIQDFTHGVDEIDLANLPGNLTFLAGKGAAFTGVAGQLRWFQEDRAGAVRDKTIVEGDTDGNKVADFQIELTGLKTITKADFFLG